MTSIFSMPLLRTVRALACFGIGVSTVSAAGWVSRMPPNAADSGLCKALLLRLNTLPDRCAQTAVPSYPGFINPPWKMLDAREHLDLIARLRIFGGGAPPTLAAQSANRLKNALRGAEGFVTAGGTLQSWQTRLLTFFDGNGQYPVPAGPQTVVAMSTKGDSLSHLEGCPGGGARRWSQTFVVRPDLSGPDLRVRPGVVSLLSHSILLLYNGAPVLISDALSYRGQGRERLRSGSEIGIYRNVAATGVHVYVCDFWFQGRNSSNRVER